MLGIGVLLLSSTKFSPFYHLLPYGKLILSLSPSRWAVLEIKIKGLCQDEFDAKKL